MKNELQKIREQKQKLKKMLYKRYKAMYDFLKFKTIQSFGMIFIKNDIIAFDMASDEQEKITKNLREFASNTKLKRLNLKKEKWHYKYCIGTFQRKRNGLQYFNSGIFSVPTGK